MRLTAAILGFGITDPRVMQYENELLKGKIKFIYATGPHGDSHPNTYRFTLKTALSADVK